MLVAHCRHHPRHGAGRSGGSHLPWSGGKYLRTPSSRQCPPSWYAVSWSSRHPEVTIRETAQGGPEKASCRGPEESICARHRAVGVSRVAAGCSRPLPFPSERGDIEVRTKPRAKYFPTAPCRWTRASYQGVCLVRAAHFRHHPRIGTGRSRERHLPRSGQKVFAHVTLPWNEPELPRRVHVLAAHGRHHPRHGTGTSGESQLPRSGGTYLRTSPCR